MPIYGSDILTVHLFFTEKDFFNVSFSAPNLEYTYMQNFGKVSGCMEPVTAAFSNHRATTNILWFYHIAFSWFWPTVRHIEMLTYSPHLNIYVYSTTSTCCTIHIYNILKFRNLLRNLQKYVSFGSKFTTDIWQCTPPILAETHTWY